MMTHEKWLSLGECTHFLTRNEQQSIIRQFSRTWEPIGDLVNEIVRKLERQLDVSWIAEYLAWNERETEKFRRRDGKGHAVADR